MESSPAKTRSAKSPEASIDGSDWYRQFLIRRFRQALDRRGQLPSSRELKKEILRKRDSLKAEAEPTYLDLEEMSGGDFARDDSALQIKLLETQLAISNRMVDELEELAGAWESRPRRGRPPETERAILIQLLAADFEARFGEASASGGFNRYVREALSEAGVELSSSATRRAIEAALPRYSKGVGN
ncbi:MAG: hypothetical protein JW819_09470 [Candidatus Krumholzibacteriota bacterium]|nr:hypothetical protein [Candidatus Krumholzibacteriota bacterium]